jgi:hypothetical protein
MTVTTLSRRSETEESLADDGGAEVEEGGVQLAAAFVADAQAAQAV